MKNAADHVSTETLPAATLDLPRCQFSFADGRRCRLPRWEAHPALCLSHARAERKTESQPADGCGLHLQPAEKKTSLHLEPAQIIELAPLSGEFRTATDVNRTLGKLFSLLAQNRIPRRNAVALGYLAQLLLQTLPGVRDEITHCLGYQAWDEALESVFPEHKTEDEAEDETEAASELETEARSADGTEAAAEDEAEDDREASPGCGLHLQPAKNNGCGLPLQPSFLNDFGNGEIASERQPPDEKDAAPAPSDPPAEIAAEPEPQEFDAQMPEHWSYWKELEQGVWAVPAAHAIK